MTPDLSAWGTITDLAVRPGGARRRAFTGLLEGAKVIAKSRALAEPSLVWQLRVEALARRAGFDTPGLIPTTSGRLSSRGWTLEPFLDGEPVDPADIPPGRLRRFHALARTRPPRPATMAAPQPGRWDRLIRAAGRNPGELGCIHGDLHRGNLLRRPSGRIALLDWEEARIGPLFLDQRACARRKAPQIELHHCYEIAACALVEPRRAQGLARALLARRWH